MIVKGVAAYFSTKPMIDSIVVGGVPLITLDSGTQRELKKAFVKCAEPRPLEIIIFVLSTHSIVIKKHAEYVKEVLGDLGAAYIAAPRVIRKGTPAANANAPEKVGGQR